MRKLALAPHCVVVFWLALFLSSCGAYMKLDGAITRVRVVETGGARNVLMVEFTVTNNAKVGYIVREALVDLSEGESVVTGETIAVRDTINMCQHLASLAGDCAEPLLTRQTIAPGETVTRLVAASFDRTAEELRNRQQLTLRIRELDRLETKLTEGAK